MRFEPVRRRRLALTPLIDVIFLLLLFFMLTSTFSRFGEIELTLGGVAQASTNAQPKQIILLRLSGDGLGVNGVPTPMERAAAEVEKHRKDEEIQLVLSVATGASSQDLVDVMHRLRGMDQANLVVVK